MEHGFAGPAFVLALEKSAWGDYVRSATLLYPIANTVHVLAVMCFFAAVAAMDTRLLGWFRGASPAAIVARFRPVAIGALIVVVATGFTLFTPEATAIIGNTAFRLKLLAIVLALANVGVLELWLRRARLAGGGLDDPRAEMAGWPRRAALISLALWLVVAACGRFIAYA